MKKLKESEVEKDQVVLAWKVARDAQGTAV